MSKTNTTILAIILGGTLLTGGLMYMIPAPATPTGGVAVPVKQGLEGHVARFSAPDQFGVVCYSRGQSSLSCVQVEGKK